MSLFILDYDETFTEDKDLWSAFVSAAKTAGHTVICCTMRVPKQPHVNKDIIEDMKRLNIKIIYAAECHDKWDAVEKAGFDPVNAIWIDDRPMYIFMNRSIDELPD